MSKIDRVRSDQEGHFVISRHPPPQNATNLVLLREILKEWLEHDWYLRPAAAAAASAMHVLARTSKKMKYKN